VATLAADAQDWERIAFLDDRHALPSCAMICFSFKLSTHEGV
jgi:hypothetical protein